MSQSHIKSKIIDRTDLFFEINLQNYVTKCNYSKQILRNDKITCLSDQIENLHIISAFWSYAFMHYLLKYTGKET